MSAADWVIFVLDDEAPVGAATCAVVEAETGAQAEAHTEWIVASRRMWEEVRKNKRLVLIADLHMPGIRGDEFCATVARHMPDVKIIIHTGSGSESSHRIARDLGARFVLKNTDPSVLIAAVRAAMVQPLSGK